MNKNGWTSTGITVEALRALDEISEVLGVTKREACSLAIMHFLATDAYSDIKKEMEQLAAIRDRYPALFKRSLYGREL